jgi:phosphate transport system substrate-binding protein
MRIQTLARSLELAAAGLILTTGAFAQAVKVDPKIPDYKPVQGVSGSIKSAGSQTLSNLMTLWLEGFKTSYPSVVTALEAKGSGSAPPALIAGTASFGPMSRTMNDKEIADFDKAFGYKPTGVAVAIDMVSVYVHKDNPIKSLTLAQIDAIYSKTRTRGNDKDIARWGDLGLTGEWADKPISLYGRDSSSGTRDYFKEHVLAKGDFKDTVKEVVGTSGVAQGVATDKFGIGYGGFGGITADIRAVPIANDAKAAAVAASADNAYNGTYPLSRFLYIYVNLKPGTELDPLRQEFLKYVLSQQGQSVVVKGDYFPLTAPLVVNNLKLIGVTAAVEAGAPNKK